MRKRALIVLALLATVGCKNFKDGFDKEFKTSFAREFATSCTKAAVDKGGVEATSKLACECLGKTLVERHTTGELTKLSMSPTSDESKKMFADAASACRPKAP
ncbi:MAG TPA: hypothetical protein VHJ20_09650 [Polyangia bacterium]|nr:hypothetical protein [Polyangia bacterium]